MSKVPSAASALSLDAIPCGILILDGEGTIQFANPRLEAMVGHDPAGLVGESIATLLPERLRTDAAVRSALLEAAEAPMGRGLNLTVQRKDGAEMPVEISVSSTTVGEQRCRVVYLTDLSIRKQQELERTKAVIDASRAFTDRIEDPPELANTIARTCVHLLGDFGAIRLLRDGGEWLDLAAPYHASPAMADRCSEFLSLDRAVRVGEGLAGRVVAENQALLWSNVQPDALIAQAAPVHRDLVRSMAVQSLLIVPIRARGAVLGCVTVARVQGKPFASEDLELVQLLADSAGVAIYNARIYGDLLRAEAEVRRLQEANARQAEIHTTMLRNIPRAAVFLVDREQRVVSAHGPCVVHMLGIPAEQVVGKRAQELVPERYRAEALGVLADTLAGKPVAFQAVRSDRVYEVRGAPIFSGSELPKAAPLPYAALFQHYDITERVQQEQEVLRTRERFRALVEHVPVGVFELDPAGTVRFTNDKFVELLGLPPEEIATVEQRSRWMQPDDRAALRDAVQVAQSEGLPFRMVLRYQLPGKPLRRLLWQCVPLRQEDENQRSFVGTVEDVTTELEAAEQLSRSLREKETLLEEIHHRVRNNLQVVTSLIDLQASRVEDERLRSVFADVRSRIQAIAFLHERMYGSPDLSAIDIADYFQGLLTSAARVAGVDPGNASVRSASGPFPLEIERAVLIGLLVNELVTNAFKYGRRAGAGPEVEVVVEHDSERARVTVSDAGPGFPRGFDPVNTRTLGLYLVKQLAEQLDGTIRYEQRPTRCIFEFPCRGA